VRRGDVEAADTVKPLLSRGAMIRPTIGGPMHPMAANPVANTLHGHCAGMQANGD
jgi:hypothetical protein